MASLIFFIVIIVILRNVLEKNREAQKKANDWKPSQQKTGQGVSGSLPQNAASQSTYASGSKTGTTVSSLSGERKHHAKKSVSGSVDSSSTTEYLRQKAIEDEKEHAQQAREEAMRLHRETGGRSVALRHYDGDSIPKGMRLVKCSYCGAENLIPEYKKQEEFTCYFCREIL